ncbi:signal recognition particle, SRP9/SRP14 subunit [Chytridium lagenaria]|nr:signal recognition particle, SRP9/SRP14 subunit [Chytridium lagenaria]
MVYIDNWDEFQKAVEDLYMNAPKRSRFVVKYRHCDGDLVLKISDGPSTIKYRTDRQQDIKKLEKLTMSLMLKMQRRKVAAPPPLQPAAPATPVLVTESPFVNTSKTATTIPSVTATNSSVPKASPASNQQNKKKKKKR